MLGINKKSMNVATFTYFKHFSDLLFCKDIDRQSLCTLRKNYVFSHARIPLNDVYGYHVWCLSKGLDVFYNISKFGFNWTKFDWEIIFQKIDAGILFFDVSEQLCCTRWTERDRVPSVFWLISERESLPWRTTLQEVFFLLRCNYFLIFNSILAVSISLRVVLHIFIMFPKQRLNVFQCLTIWYCQS